MAKVAKEKPVLETVKTVDMAICEIECLVIEARNDAMKAIDKGNKAAATRARVLLIKVKKACDEARGLLLPLTKSGSK